MRPKLKRTAQKRGISNTGCADAWFYENTGSIDFYMAQGERTVYCRIQRAALADWVKRTEKATQ